MKFVASVAFADPVSFPAVARAADESGWDALAISDHVIHPEAMRAKYPYTPDGVPRFHAGQPWADPFVAIAAMASVTTRLRFMTNVYVLPMRNVFLAAKAIGTAALLSGGRVELGIGVGWMEDEFDLLGQPFRARGARTDEMIDVMRKLWTGEMVEHHGEAIDFPRLQMSPGVPHRIPIHVGGLSDAALRRAAQRGDGWISEIHTTEQMREIVTKLRGLRAAAGRGGEPFSVFAALLDAFDPDAIRRLADIGVTHYTTMPWVLHGHGMEATTQQKVDSLRRYADEVIAKVRG
jgi:probable F420-dependent oxidoreductase